MTANRYAELVKSGYGVYVLMSPVTRAREALTFDAGERFTAELVSGHVERHKKRYRVHFERGPVFTLATGGVHGLWRWKYREDNTSALEFCGRLLDTSIKQGMLPEPELLAYCRLVAEDLRKRGMVDGAVFIEDRIREAYARSGMQKATEYRK